MALADGTALYRVFGEADLLLYVGVSKSFGSRWEQHAKTQPWWDEHRWMRVEWRETRKEAEEAESLAIEAERPKYNKSKGVLILSDAPLRRSPPRDAENDLPSVVDWILATPQLPPAEIRLALGRLRHGAPPADSAAFVRYAVKECGVGLTQAKAAAKRRAA